MNRDEIVATLEKNYRFNREGAIAALRAAFRCEYCGVDLLKDLYFYQLYNIDHIDPHGPDANENYALACALCNQLKGYWSPNVAAPVAGRDELLIPAKAYVALRRQDRQHEFDEVKKFLSGN